MLHFKLQMYLHSVMAGNNKMEDFAITRNPFLEAISPLPYLSSVIKMGQLIFNLIYFIGFFF